jgi:flagellar biosynthetic protein FliR
MKTIPQFNLLVVGFPIKIGLSFMVIIAILSSMMFLFKRDVLNQISAVNKIIGGG